MSISGHQVVLYLLYLFSPYVANSPFTYYTPSLRFQVFDHRLAYFCLEKYSTRILEQSKQCLFEAGIRVARPICPDTYQVAQFIELQDVRSRTAKAGSAYYVFLAVYLIKRPA